MAKEEMLDVVDENDNFLRRELRSIIHRDGLFHREIHVFFITPNRQLIFQRRADDKDTYPGLLDSTVGGHVDPGDTYETAAVREVEEETGLKVSIDDLAPLAKTTTKSFDDVTGMTNNCHRMVYGYVYKGRIEDLKVEDKQGTGFRAMAYDDVMQADNPAERGMIASLLSEPVKANYAKLAALVNA